MSWIGGGFEGLRCLYVRVWFRRKGRNDSTCDLFGNEGRVCSMYVRSNERRAASCLLEGMSVGNRNHNGKSAECTQAEGEEEERERVEVEKGGWAWMVGW